jgi:hypothetical protein
VQPHLPDPTAILLAAAAISSAGADEQFSATAEESVDAKRAEIRTEIQALGAHDWAGEYYAGDGLGVNTTLVLAPRAGYVFEWAGCLGLYDRNYGAITSESRRLRLTFTFDNAREAFRGIAPEFIVVDWEARRYLVPADDVIGFCNEVNQGAEPRTRMHGQYLLRRGDETKQVSGAPELPLEYRDCLLASPVQANVVGVGAPTLRPSTGKWTFKDTPLTLDAGFDQGLRLGMELVVIEPRNLVETVRITRVEGSRAEATITQLNEESLSPEVGWRVSTRAPWHGPSK